MRKSIFYVTILLVSGFTGWSAEPEGTAEFNSSFSGLPSNEEIFGWIQELCSFGYRRPGSAADLRAAEYLRDKFQEFGLQEVRLDPVPLPLWTAKQWSLTVNGQSIPCFYLAHSYWVKEYEGFSAGPEGITAELVYVGEGTEKDFHRVEVKGKIVLADIRFSQLYQSDSVSIAYFAYDPRNTTPADWHQANPYSPNNFPSNFQRAIKYGAVGFIGILADYYDRNTYYNEIYGEAPCQWPIPGLWLSRSDGARVKSLLREDAPNQATLVLDGEITPAVANNVIGFLPGKTDEIILVHSHHDAPWASAVEDASGVAEVLALAKYFGSVPAEQRQKTLMFASLDTHFSMYQGHLQLIRQIQGEQRKVLIDIVLEHIGKEVVNQDGAPVETGLVEPRGIFVTENEYLISLVSRVVERHNLERTVLLPTYTILGVPTDAGDFNRAGFSIISLISPPLYIYDVMDTPELVAKEQLRPVAAAFAEIIESLDQTPAVTISEKSWIPRYRFRYYSAAVRYLLNYLKP